MNEQDKLPSLEEFEARLRAAQAAGAKDGKSGPDGAPGQRASGIGLAFRFSVEMVSAVAVGGVIGYALDHWLGTRPWAMVVMLFVGGAAGVMNVYRAARGFDDSVGLGEAARRSKETERQDMRSKGG